MSITKQTLCAVSDCGCAPDECECWIDQGYGCEYPAAHGVPGWNIEWWPWDGFRISYIHGCYEQSLDVEDADDLPRAARAMRAVRSR